MCGIAGYIGLAAPAHVTLGLKRMADAVAHRGPDDQGFFESEIRAGGRVGLAHRRLAIIDLTQGGQPLGNEDGTIQIVFNGEIYNFAALRQELESAGHVFRTHSDTETIVHAYEQWGDACVDRLLGMFAFALWDGPRQRLLLARDRFGKKPLFVMNHHGLLLFASEIKSLLAFPGVQPRFNERCLIPYLVYRYVPGPATMFEGIRKLMPGTVAVVEGGVLAERGFYTSPDALPMNPGPGSGPGDSVKAFLDLLDDAVRMRMVADVPFGAFLSGGLDSSAIVALMARHASGRVKTFSVGFAEARYSELNYARVVAKAFDTDHHEVQVSQADIVEQLPALVRFRDAPLSEPSDVPVYLLARAAQREVKMVLTGEGADEMLGGYPKHVFERFSAGYLRLPARLRDSALRPLAQALPFDFQRAKTAVASMGLADFSQRMPRWFGALGLSQVGQLLAPGAWKPANLAEHLPVLHAAAGNSALRSILHFDQTHWLPDNLLERGDRMTMAASIEARMPFMDHRLLALVSALPDHCRVRGIQTKWILREAMKQLVPGPILTRRKVGFRVPVNEWFRSSMKSFVMDALASPMSRVRRYFDAECLDALLVQHMSGRQNHEKLIWALVNLEVLHREYRL